MRKRLLQALTRLASVPYQDAYIVGGTTDSYALPEDIVEEVASLCTLADKDQYGNQFDPRQQSALTALLETIRSNGPAIFARGKSPSAKDLIHSNQRWAAMRSEAGRCLLAFGIDIAKVLPQEIDDNKELFSD